MEDLRVMAFEYEIIDGEVGTMNGGDMFVEYNLEALVMTIEVCL